MEWVEVAGKTVEEATEQALDQLGVAVGDAEVIVVDEPKTGLFGRVRVEARVRARVRPVGARPRRERSRRSGGGRSGQGGQGGQGSRQGGQRSAAGGAGRSANSSADADSGASGAAAPTGPAPRRRDGQRHEPLGPAPAQPQQGDDNRRGVGGRLEERLRGGRQPRRLRNGAPKRRRQRTWPRE